MCSVCSEFGLNEREVHGVDRMLELEQSVADAQRAQLGGDVDRFILNVLRAHNLALQELTEAVRQLGERTA